MQQRLSAKLGIQSLTRTPVHDVLVHTQNRKTSLTPKQVGSIHSDSRDDGIGTSTLGAWVCSMHFRLLDTVRLEASVKGQK